MPASSGSPTPARSRAIWSTKVLPSLSGLTKAMYQSADLLGVDGGTARIRVDNDHHRQNCDRKRADVEQALADALGHPVSIRFEVAAGPGGPAAGSAPAPAPSSGGRAPRPVADLPDDPDEHLAGADVHDLDDAPDAPTGGLAALTEAFPGAELLDET
ncbi:MAG: hypothetical protein U0P45_05120 [Acidimicrobiales bacterium]